ncbi:MAG TPA: hypothetical protein VFD70_21455 [Anaerolineae bacterium]|nr:hypothetical protein [Anaerolineae bacterium]
MAKAPTELKYPELFTALGKFIADKKLQNVCVIEFEDGVIVTGSVFYNARDEVRRREETFVLSTNDLRKMIPHKRSLFGG